MMTQYIDEDGYPTIESLDMIRRWDFGDSQGWFSFIKGLWHQKHFGWSEVTDIDEISKRQITKLYLSTGGWSGNESIIAAMNDNTMLWSWHWYSSRRGGHYIFYINESKKEIGV